MNWLHIHLALTHFPVVGTVFGVVLLAVAMARKSAELTTVSLGVFIVIAVLTIPVHLTGEAAEEAIEHRPGVPVSILETHERAALLSVVMMEVLGAASVGGLIVLRWFTWLAKRWLAAVAVVAIIVSAMMARTANLGGQIGHPEIRSGSSSLHADENRE